MGGVGGGGAGWGIMGWGLEGGKNSELYYPWIEKNRLQKFIGDRETDRLTDSECYHLRIEVLSNNLFLQC